MLKVQDQFRIAQGGQNSYAQGLNDLSNMFESQRQQDLQTGLGAANSIREGNENRNSLMQNDFSQV